MDQKRKNISDLDHSELENLTEKERFFYIGLVNEVCIGLSVKRTSQMVEDEKNLWIKQITEQNGIDQFISLMKEKNLNEMTDQSIPYYFYPDWKVYFDALQTLCYSIKLSKDHKDFFIQRFVLEVNNAFQFDLLTRVSFVTEFSYLLFQDESLLELSVKEDKEINPKDQLSNEETEKDNSNKDINGKNYLKIRTEFFDLLSANGIELNETIELKPKWEISLFIFENLLSNFLTKGYYDSRTRTFIKEMISIMEPTVTWKHLLYFESSFGQKLFEYYQFENDTELKKKREKEIVERDKKANLKKYGMVGATAVAGGVLIGLTAGLAAPLIAAGVGVVFGASTTAFLASSGGIALTSGIFAGVGASLGKKSMENRLGDLKQFQFIPLNNSSQGNLFVTIVVSGWITEYNDYINQWNSLNDFSENFSLLWEIEELKKVTSTLSAVAYEIGFKVAADTIISFTLLASLAAAAAVPLGFLNLKYAVDNIWSRCMERAEKAGILLADVLIERQYGHKPVVLIGHSFGARLIFYALLELAKRKNSYKGIVDCVCLLGAPISTDKSLWLTASSVVSGTITNCYVPNDFVLGVCYRATSITLNIAGISPIDLPSTLVKNVDVSSIVAGHNAYAENMEKLLVFSGFTLDETNKKDNLTE